MVSLFHVQLKVPLLIRSVDHAGTSNLSFSTDWGNAFSSAFRILNENSPRWLWTEFGEMFSCTFRTVKVAFWPWTYTWRHSNENRDEKHQHLLSLLFQMRALCHVEIPRPPIPFSNIFLGFLFPFRHFLWPTNANENTRIKWKILVLFYPP